MEKIITFISVFVFCLFLCAQNSENINIKETTKNKWISIDAGLHYLHIPKDRRYIPRREGGFASDNPIHVGYTQNCYPGPFIGINYGFSITKNILFDAGLTCFNKKTKYTTDADSIQMYKPFPETPYVLESIKHSNALYFRYNVGYSFKRIHFFLGFAIRILEDEKTKSIMEDGTLRKSNVFTWWDVYPVFVLFFPRYLSLHYQITDKALPVSIFLQYDLFESPITKNQNKYFMIGLRFKINNKIIAK